MKTRLSQQELSKLGRKLNDRMRALERENLQSTVDYRRLKKLAIESGGKVDKNGRVRFKQSFKKEKIKNQKAYTKAEQFGKDTRKLKKLDEEIRRRFDKGDIPNPFDMSDLSDILEAQKSGVWGGLKRYFDSDEVVEIIVEKRGTNEELSRRLQELELVYERRIVDKPVWMDYLKGWMSREEMMKIASMSSEY